MVQAQYCCEWSELQVARFFDSFVPSRSMIEFTIYIRLLSTVISSMFYPRQNTPCGLQKICHFGVGVSDVIIVNTDWLLPIHFPMSVSCQIMASPLNTIALWCYCSILKCQGGGPETIA